MIKNLAGAPAAHRLPLPEPIKLVLRFDIEVAVVGEQARQERRQPFKPALAERRIEKNDVEARFGGRQGRGGF